MATTKIQEGQVEKYKLKLLPICPTERVTLLSLKLFKNSRALLTPMPQRQKIREYDSQVGPVEGCQCSAPSTQFTDEN